MSNIKEETRVIFKGTPTTEKERKELQLLGYVHVTGLRTIGDKNKPYIIGEKLTVKNYGTRGNNNGVFSLITNGGEGTGFVGIRTDKLNEFAPNGEGAYVPCSNGERVSMRDLLNRIADPGCGIIVE